MIVIFFLLLAGLFLWRPVQAQSFTYQFELENNSIDFDFTKIEPSTDLPINISATNNILAFAYKIKLQDSLPADIPLFIVVFNKQIIFSVNTQMLNENINEVEIDIAQFLTKDFTQWPVFYKNNVVRDFDLEVLNISLKNAFSIDRTQAQIHDLNVIKENDNSLTVLFTLEEPIKRIHSYQLFCLNEKQEVVASVPLHQRNNFLWPECSFINLLTNQKNELIFNLLDFDCAGNLYVVGDEKFTSNQTSIVKVENL